MSKNTSSIPIRVGFVGCGTHAVQNLYPCLGAVGAELYAVADLSAERRELAKRNWRPTKLFSSYQDLISSGEIDALFVAGPASLHENVIEQGIMAGVPIFAEKPPATTAARARELANLAAERGVSVMVGFMKRFAPAYTRAFESSAKAEFGGRLHLNVRYGHGLRQGLESSLPVMGIHAIDLVRFFMGEPVDTQVRRQRVGAGENLSLQMVFANESLATVLLDSTLPAVLERFELAGDGHFITIDDVVHYRHYGSNESIWGTPSYQARTPNFGLQTTETSSHTLQGYTGEVAEFIESIVEGRPINGPTLSDGAAALELCDLIASTSDGESISLTQVK